MNRAEQLSVVAQAAAECAATAACRLLVIAGPGGAGKTALALHGLHAAAGRFPGGHLYADLGGFSLTGPVLPGAILARWLRALGTDPAQVPADPGEAAALYRSITAASPVAVLADDAASAAQARALLPGAGLLVVTTRRRLAGLTLDGATWIPVGPLEPPAAVELAALAAGARAEAEPEATRALADLCGCLPLAVRAAAARLAARSRLPVQHVVDQLAGARHRLAALDSEEISVTAALDGSYQALTPQAALAYRLLALCPGPSLTAPVAAAALDTDPAAADVLLDALAAASLLEDLGGSRYRYHDLVREHARGKASEHHPPGQRAAATARVIDHYLRASAAADLPVLPGRLRLAPVFFLAFLRPAPAPRVAAALAWTDTEINNLLAAQLAAAEAGLHSMAWQFADTMWGWLSRRHDYPAWHAICQRALAAAETCADSRAQVFIRIRLGRYYLNVSDHEQARAHLSAALDIARATGDRAGEASAREHAGLLDLAAQHPAEAITQFERGLACWDQAGGHRRGQAILHRQAGRAHTALGDHDNACRHLQAALTAFTELGERFHQARTLIAIAETHLAAGHPRDALALMEQAMPLMEEEDSALSQAHIRTVIAQAHHQAGQAGPAREFLQQALATYESLRIPDNQPAYVRARDLAARIGMPATQEPDQA